MRKFVVLINENCEDEKILVEIKQYENLIILIGDYYHDKIDFLIDGFFEGLSYVNIEHEHSEKIINFVEDIYDYEKIKEKVNSLKL